MVNHNDEHSEEVRDIMGQKANWMVRWGAAVLVLIVAIVIGIFFLIRYPVFVTVPFQVEAATAEMTEGAVVGEAVVSESVYDQIEVGQEVRVMLTVAGNHAVSGRVDAKMVSLRVRLLFPAAANKQKKLRATLQGVGNAKIKTGERRLISQLSNLYLSR